MNPNIELMVDDMLEQSQRDKLTRYLEKWLKNKIVTILKSLFDLKELQDKNSSIKALAYQLYENNGVLKRDRVSEYIKKLDQRQRTTTKSKKHAEHEGTSVPPGRRQQSEVIQNAEHETQNARPQDATHRTRTCGAHETTGSEGTLAKSV